MMLTVPDPADVLPVQAPDGAVLFVRRYGNPEGRRLVLCHGNGLAADAYYPFWRRFLADYDLFVFDLRNHGWNPVGDRTGHTVPRFVTDGERVIRQIGLRYGAKPVTGVYHSLSATVALHQAYRDGEFEALILFDLPLCPHGGRRRDMEMVMIRLAELARKRSDRFECAAQYAEALSRIPEFDRIEDANLELLAEATLRAENGDCVLRCPKAYESQICDSHWLWSMTADLERVKCPIKVFGGDPKAGTSYLPGSDSRALSLTKYEVVPDTTHLLVLQRPEQCAALTIDWLRRREKRSRGSPLLDPRDA